MLNLNILRELALPSTRLTSKDGALQLQLDDMLCNDGKAKRQAPRRFRLTQRPTSLCGSALAVHQPPRGRSCRRLLCGRLQASAGPEDMNLE